MPRGKKLTIAGKKKTGAGAGYLGAIVYIRALRANNPVQGDQKEEAP